MDTRPFDWADDDWPALALHGALDGAIERWGPEKVAYSYPDAGVEMTLGEVRGQAQAWARAMAAAGVGAGDRVGVALPGSPLWPVIQVACSLLGAVVVGINTRYGSQELAHVLGSSRPVLVVTVANRRGRRFADLLADVVADLPAARRPQVVLADGSGSPAWTSADAFLANGAGSAIPVSAARPDDVALIQYTSGSTSAPKGVELSHDAVLRVAFHVLMVAGYDADDVVYSALPFYHVGGSITTGAGAIVNGARMVIPEVYDSLGSVRQMIEHRCTAVQGHAAMFTMQIDAAREHGLLDRLMLRKGWAAASPTVMRRIVEELGIADLVPVYGMSEYGLIAAGDRREPAAERVTGIGWPVPGTEVRLAGAAVPGDVGEVEVRGSQVMLRYHGDPKATEQAITSDGFLSTGDLGRWDERGRLVFAGRVKEMIKPGGENVSAAEVEEFLREDPRIAAVAVIPVRDRRLGQAPAAVVQPAAGAEVDLESVRRFCAGRIARFKTPKAVFVEDELPMLANGKVDKVTLVMRYGDHEVVA